MARRDTTASTESRGQLPLGTIETCNIYPFGATKAENSIAAISLPLLFLARRFSACVFFAIPR